MKIFISWSGDKSCRFAESLKVWLEQVLPGTEVWLSSEDIDKGTIWFSEIIKELEKCHCGVLCITEENKLSPWIHFEAGGMIKGLGKKRIATILLDLDYGELQQPLNQFNGLKPDKVGMRHLISSFNKVNDIDIKQHVILKQFERFWEELEAQISELFPSPDNDTKTINGKSPSVYEAPKQESPRKVNEQAEPDKADYPKSRLEDTGKNDGRSRLTGEQLDLFD